MCDESAAECAIIINATIENFFLYPNITNKSNNQSEGAIKTEGNWSALILLIIIAWGVLGNTLVCISIITEKRLHNVTNYFLFSLAIADLLVCLVVMPLSMMNELNEGIWPYGYHWCVLYVSTDVFLCSVSIVHMSVISLDRYWGISRPLKTRNKSKSIVALKIFSCWLITILIACPITVLSMSNPLNVLRDNICQVWNSYFQLYGSALSFFIPLIIMAVTYAKTTNLLRDQQAAMCGGAEVNLSISDQRNPQGNKTAAPNIQLRRSTTTRAKKKSSNGSGSDDRRRHSSNREIEISRLSPTVLSAQKETDYEASVAGEKDVSTVICQSANKKHFERYLRFRKCPISMKESPIMALRLKKRAKTCEEISALHSPLSCRPRHSTSCSEIAFSTEMNCDKDALLSNAYENQQNQTERKTYRRQSSILSQRRRSSSSKTGQGHNFKDTIEKIHRSSLFVPLINPCGRLEESSDNNCDITQYTDAQTLNITNTSSIKGDMKQRLRDNFQKATSKFLRPITGGGNLATEQKATKVLGVVFFCFFVCWTPFFAMNTVMAICQDHCSSIPTALASVFLWLGYISSTVNPIIYTTFNRKFRSSFARILRCRRQTPQHVRHLRLLSVKTDTSWRSGSARSQKHNSLTSNGQTLTTAAITPTDNLSKPERRFSNNIPSPYNYRPDTVITKRLSFCNSESVAIV